MFYDGLWGIDMVGFTGGGGGWVRLGASRFWNARFGSSLNIMMLERVSMLY